MNTTRIFSAAAAVALGAGLALSVSTAPAQAAPGISEGQAECGALGGSYSGGYDGWWCTYVPGIGATSIDDPTLTAACSGQAWAVYLEDGVGSVGFNCSYV
jgi:hypothetical protein